MSLAPLVLVYAAARGGVIGRAGGLPWTLPEDRAHFESVTRGHAVIMGRRTWDETGRPLEGRRNIVVSRQRALALQGGEVAATLEDAIVLARAADDAPRVIGGAAILALAVRLATRIELTEIDRDIAGDTRFVLDRRGFTETARRRGEDATLSFVTLAR